MNTPPGGVGGRRHERDQRSPVDVTQFSYGNAKSLFSAVPDRHNGTDLARTEQQASPPVEHKHEHPESQTFSLYTRKPAPPVVGPSSKISMGSMESPAPPMHRLPSSSSTSRPEIPARRPSSNSRLMPGSSGSGNHGEEDTFADYQGYLNDDDGSAEMRHTSSSRFHSYRAVAGSSSDDDDASISTENAAVGQDSSRDISVNTLETHEAHEATTDESTGEYFDPASSSFGDYITDKEQASDPKYDFLSAAIAANIAEQEFYQKQKIKEQRLKAATKREPIYMSLSSSRAIGGRQPTRMSLSRFDLPDQLSFREPVSVEPTELIVSEIHTSIVPGSPTMTPASKISAPPSRENSISSHSSSRREKLMIAMGAMGSTRQLRGPVARKPPPATHSLKRTSASSTPNSSSRHLVPVSENKAGTPEATATFSSLGSSNHSIGKDEKTHISEFENSIRQFHSVKVPKLESFSSGLDLDSELMDLIVSRTNERAEQRRNQDVTLAQFSSNRLYDDPEKRAEIEARRSAHANMAKKPAAKLGSPLRTPVNPAKPQSMKNIVTPPSTGLEWTESGSSGLELDAKTMEAIMSRSAHQTARRRETSGTTTNPVSGSKEAERINRASAIARAAQMTPTTNAARRSVEELESQADEKAAFRRGTSSSTSTHSSRLTGREQHKLAPVNDEYGQNNLPYSNNAEVEVCANNVGEALEAQAGVTVLLPGAFAVDGLDHAEGNSGYDSCFEEEGSESGDGPDVENPGRIESVLRLAPPAADGQESVASADERDSNFSQSPLEAELHDRVIVDGQVVTNDEEKDIDAEKLRAQQICLWCGIIATLVIIGAVILGVFLPRGSEAKGPNVTEVVVEGWQQISTLLGPMEEDLAQFGFDISLSGDGKRMAIGTPGMDSNARVLDIGVIHIVDFNGTAWTQVAAIEGSISLAQAGRAVSLSKDGKRVAISSPFAGSGSVAVFQESDDGDWKIVGKPLVRTSGDVNSIFGSAVSLSGDGRVVAVGEAFHGIPGANPRVGRVLVYAQNGSDFMQIGNEIVGSEESEHLGSSVALSNDGRRIVIGAVGANEFTGSIRIFEYGEKVWNQIGDTIFGTQAMERMGTSVDISDDGSVVAAGAPEYAIDSETAKVGLVQVFKLDEEGKEWQPLGSPIVGEAEFDTFGNDVALSSSGLTIAIGAPESDKFGENNGQIQIFTYSNSSWNQIGSQIGSMNAFGAQFGFSVAMSDDASVVAGGAPFANYDGFRNSVGEVLTFTREDL